MSNSNTTEKVHQLISQFAKIRVIASDPDMDSIGTAWGLKLWLEQQDKQVELKIYMPPDELVQNVFAEYSIDFAQAYSPAAEFEHPNDTLCIFLDAYVLKQVFGQDGLEVAEKINVERSVVIDHHPQSGEPAIIPAQFVISRPASCTAEVVYTELISTSSHPDISLTIAECFYYALQGDTGNFSYGVIPGTFAFADNLIAAGVNVRKMTQRQTPYSEFEFLVWAVPHTKLMSELKLALLAVDNATVLETTQQFGPEFWNSTNLYKATFGKNLSGYDYGVILREKQPGVVSLNWRTRDWGNTVEIKQVATAAGFTAGGHRNAGGGEFQGTLAQAVPAFTTALTQQLNQLN